MSAVFDLGGSVVLTTAQRFVLLALANHANDAGEQCFPGLDHLSEKCAIGASTVRKHIHALAEKGFVTSERLTRKGGGWGQLIYTLHLPGLDRPQDVVDAEKPEQASSQNCELDSDEAGGVEISTRPQNCEVEFAKPTNSSSQNEPPPPRPPYKDEPSMEPSKPLLLLPADGGQDGSSSSESASPEEQKQTSPEQLGDDLRELGIVEKLIPRILINCPHDRIREQLKIYESNLEAGATHGVGVLVKALTGGPDVKPVRAKRKRKPEQSASLKPYEPTAPEPVHEVRMICGICAMEYTGMSDEELHCPNCGTSPFDQQIPRLVEMGIHPSSRLDRLPAKARKILKAKAEVTV